MCNNCTRFKPVWCFFSKRGGCWEAARLCLTVLNRFLRAALTFRSAPKRLDFTSCKRLMKGLSFPLVTTVPQSLRRRSVWVESSRFGFSEGLHPRDQWCSVQQQNLKQGYGRQSGVPRKSLECKAAGRGQQVKQGQPKNG